MDEYTIVSKTFSILCGLVFAAWGGAWITKGERGAGALLTVAAVGFAVMGLP